MSGGVQWNGALGASKGCPFTPVRWVIGAKCRRADSGGSYPGSRIHDPMYSQMYKLVVSVRRSGWAMGSLLGAPRHRAISSGEERTDASCPLDPDLVPLVHRGRQGPRRRVVTFHAAWWVAPPETAWDQPLRGKAVGRGAGCALFWRGRCSLVDSASAQY